MWIGMKLQNKVFSKQPGLGFVDLLYYVFRFCFIYFHCYFYYSLASTHFEPAQYAVLFLVSLSIKLDNLFEFFFFS